MEATLQDHQKVLTELLEQVDRICRKHKISYMLFAGTALGAVRQGGFIPWDDDLDILMLRAEYDRFLAVAGEELDSRYFLQGEYSQHWPMFFSKLRKNGTACIERFVPKDPQIHQGVYIDIFPCDNLSDRWLVRKLQFLASKVVIAKGLDARGYLTDNVLKKLFMAACRLVPLKPARALALLEKKRNTDMVHCFFAAASRYDKSVFPRAWVAEQTQLPFEGGSYPVPKYYEQILTVPYGADYMTPAPPEQRGIKIHAELVDLENSYETYAGIQKTMEFREYTRSIR